MSTLPALPPDSADDAAPSTGAVTLIVFRVAGLWLASAAHHVEEICDLKPPIPFPRAPLHVAGLMNLRGHALALLNLQIFLQLPAGVAPREQHSLPRVLLISCNAMRAGVMCDQVRALQQVPARCIAPAGTQSGLPQVRYAPLEVCTPEIVAPLLDMPSVLEAARVRR